MSDAVNLKDGTAFNSKIDNSKILHPGEGSNGRRDLNNNRINKPINDAKNPPARNIKPFRSCLKNDSNTK